VYLLVLLEAAWLAVAPANLAVLLTWAYATPCTKSYMCYYYYFYCPWTRWCWSRGL